MFFIFDKYLLSAVIQPEISWHIASWLYDSKRLVWDG
jgi:hypothetical protein